MCSGNYSGNCHAENFVVWYGLYRHKISSFEIHCQLMLVFGDGELRLRCCRERCREFRSGLASITIIAPVSPADQENLNTAEVVELVMQNHQDTIQSLSIAMEWFVVTVPNIVYNWDTALCEGMMVTKMPEGSSHKLIFGGALSLLQSFKERVNGVSESVATLWDMGSQFYSKCTLMQ